MNSYKTSLVFADMLALLFGSFWIILKLKSMTFDDLIANIGISLLLIYVSIGNLIFQFRGDE
jgi:hypothetical protein